MLPSAEFICLRVTYCEAFWEELSRLIWRGRSIRRSLLFWAHVKFFHSLPSRVGCSFQGKMFSIFQLLCLVLLDVIFSPALSWTAVSVLFVIALRSSWENFFADTRLFCSRKSLTYPGSASVQCGLHGRTDYPLLQALTFFTVFTQTSVSYWTLLLSRK